MPISTYCNSLHFANKFLACSEIDSHAKCMEIKLLAFLDWHKIYKKTHHLYQCNI